MKDMQIYTVLFDFTNIHYSYQLTIFLKQVCDTIQTNYLVHQTYQKHTKHCRFG